MWFIRAWGTCSREGSGSGSCHTMHQHVKSWEVSDQPGSTAQHLDTSTTHHITLIVVSPPPPLLHTHAHTHTTYTGHPVVSLSTCRVQLCSCRRGRRTVRRFFKASLKVCVTVRSDLESEQSLQSLQTDWANTRTLCKIHWITTNPQLPV